MALQVLRRVEVRGAYADISLDVFLERFRLPPADRALATELVYGVCRRMNTLDWAIETVSSRPVSDMTAWVRNALRIGAYQLLYLDRIPVAVAANETVELVKAHGHGGTVRFANAVMRALAREAPGLRDDLSAPAAAAQGPGRADHRRLSLVYSHPEWLVRRLVDELGESEALAFMEADNSPPPLTVRVNTLKTTADALLGLMRSEGIEAERCRFVPDGLVLRGGAPYAGLPAHRGGLMQAQDEGSMLVAHVVDPRPGELVVDACAAPGGKTTHMAQLMGNRGRIVACDAHAGRLRLVTEICGRLGVSIVETVECDSRTLRQRLGPDVLADRVLVDAPCTGLGTLRRRPDARWRKDPSDPSRMAALQAEILRSSARCVKPGGVLVYSTCTVGREENQDVVRSFLADEPGFSMDDMRPLLTAALRVDVSAEGWLQLLPHRHGTDGFFICRMRRESARG